MAEEDHSVGDHAVGDHASLPGAGPHGDVRANISRRIVQLHKEYYGKGPNKAKTYVQDDLVIVLLRGGFTKVEETLLDEGRGDAVTLQRMQFQQVMGVRFKEVIEGETGRQVVAFMSGSHQEPDLLAEVFVLDSTDLTHDEPADSGPPAPSGD